MTSSRKSQFSGFTLIEVMVSLILLSGGLLAVAYMQNYALRFGQESYHRGQTLVSANELIEGMSAMQISSTSAGVVDYTTPVTAADALAGCDITASSAENDMVCFMESISQNLPFGTAEVQVNAGDNRYFDITAYWYDRGIGQQAGFSDEDISDASASSVNLNNAAECNGEENRAWSSGNGLTWPFGNDPDTDVCLVSHTWSVQILDTGTL